ncbi:hypothetical protein ACFHWD_00430 [Clostridium sp. MT-14]|jgi:hypothetical protein|uniref:Uncharacterized protein n=1 Tax=Clostridium aromativorans TaxID=2836848 RepID=A0ABS8N0M6_9CLOT|nr:MULTISPECIES: hypothetical protein [Clostridium]KAA8667376.1 hypothetical protein F3O63_15755 [Clostridium sp. HV4-5-A1G]MCC9293338.1 hypothetical protein [Clostridium aromativorans]CAB1252126.1 conserved hypothetical protein [Clostridiaceae bacterium BL-3]
MGFVKIIDSNDNFKSHLINLLDLNNLQYNVSENKDGVEKAKYIIMNSINKKHDILDGRYYFINMDLIDGLGDDLNLQGYIITYGLGSKNTVTISSLDYNSGFVYCLQRDIVQNGQNIIESQEIPINMVLRDIDELYAAMIAITLGLMDNRYMHILLKNKAFKIFS